ncbi:MAG: 16S rRNA (adenine(1518)-N(6)/adenine(1519)-N(6))-dimethyltransferase RsmA [Chromatiales bacterium]|nr:MAG: 16S rRNA (adenine(1518)-N(6)/adenine(1519)-N(6))-dimethyltransferase RsmA [Chromatiales bacterium]
MNYGPPRKRFGQHFLHDPSVLDRIVQAIDPAADDHVVEIGPGRGALTRPLLGRVARLDVVELDRDLAARLEVELQDSRLHVHQGDALRFDFRVLGTDLRLVGNLPYNISTPLLFHLLEQSDCFRDLHVMLQKEVVDRMAAAPGGRDYGRLTVALAARCRVERLFVIRPGAFSPPPRVDSAFARLVPDPEKRAQIDSEPVFDQVVTRAFSQRRKQLANSLRGLVDAAGLQTLGIDPTSRPETLDVAAFTKIANYCARKNS